jgi:tRNA pseudouridine38-40 synthase
MVRRIVGTLVEVGRGKMDKQQIASILLPLSSQERGAGGEIKNIAEFTAPPSGLFLEKIEY